MNMTLNQALEVLKNGDENKAWEIAKLDEGLLPTVTKEAWIAFANKALARREAEENQAPIFWD
jgi:hypothetical protein